MKIPLSISSLLYLFALSTYLPPPLVLYLFSLSSLLKFLSYLPDFSVMSRDFLLFPSSERVVANIQLWDWDGSGGRSHTCGWGKESILTSIQILFNEISFNFIQLDIPSVSSPDSIFYNFYSVKYLLTAHWFYFSIFFAFSRSPCFLLSIKSCYSVNTLIFSHI